MAVISVRAFTFAELDKVKIEEMRVMAKEEQGTRNDLVATLQQSIDEDSFPFAELDKAKIEEMRVMAAQSRDENQGRPKLVATLQPVIDDDSFPDPPTPKKPDTSGWSYATDDKRAGEVCLTVASCHNQRHERTR